MWFPTDATPPNQRRLAEYDALVDNLYRLPNTWKTHLCGDRETTSSIPLDMVIPFSRGRGRGRQEWFNERPTERSNGGLGRGFSCGNGREIRGEISQVHTVRNQQDRQEEEWSVPNNIGRREDDTVRWESQRAFPMHPLSEDRLFTDWSSLDSPWARTTPWNASVREIEQDINQPDNQTIQPGSEPAQIEATGNALCDNVTSPSTHQQLDQVGARLIDMGTNTSDIEVRPQRDGARVIDSDDDDAQVSCPHVDVILPTGTNEQVHMPHINLSISRYDPESLRGSHTRTHDTRMQEMIPQLDGPVSVQSRSRRRMSENARIEQESFQRTTTSHRREYPGESSDDTHSDRRPYRDWRPPERGRYQGQNGRPLDRGNYQDRG